MQSRIGYSAIPRLIVAFGGIVSVVVGLTVMLGWHLQNLTLIQVRPSLSPMQFNTALCFFLNGAGLLFKATGRTRPASMAGAATLIVGLLTLAQSAFGLNLRLDQIFMEGYVSLDYTHPGRMSPIAAACFVLTGLALISEPLVPSRVRSLSLGLLGSIVSALSFVALIGYFLETTLTLGWVQFTRMAIHTATTFMVLGVAVLALSWEDERREHRGPRWQQLIPLGVGILTATVFLWQALLAREEQQLRQDVATAAVTAGLNIEAQLKLHLQALIRMARRWELGGRPSQEAWEADATLCINDFKGYHAIEWVDSDLKIRWVVPLPGNESFLGMDLSSDPQRKATLESSRNRHVMSVSQTLELQGGGRGIAARVPIFYHGQFEGFILGVFRIDKAFGSILESLEAQGYAVAIYDADQQVFSYGADGAQPGPAIYGETDLDISGARLRLRLWPHPNRIADAHSYLPMATLVIGLFMNGLLMMSLYLAQMAHWRTEELRYSQNFLHGIVENAPLAIFAINFADDHKFTLWNKKAEELFSVPREHVLGQRAYDLIPPQFVDRYRSIDEQVIREGRMMDIDDDPAVSLTKGDIFLRTRKIPLLDRDGKATQLLAICDDVTERRLSDQQLVRAKVAAEVANLAKSEFLANMSHEIRTPMNGIIGMTELTLATELTSKQRRYLDRVKSSADSLLSLINDILDFSKIEAGKLDLDPINFNLRELLEDTMSVIELRAQQKGVEIGHRIDPELPEQLVGDAMRLRQILINLLTNAIKFTDLGGRVWLEVKADSRKDHETMLHFTVRDTGIGIPSEKQMMIFAPFTQADSSTTRKFGGTGLGLAISSRLVQLMGGQIWVESEVGRGSLFHFTACLRRPERPAEPSAVLKEFVTARDAEFRARTRSFSSVSGLLPTGQHSLNILLAEDNEVNQELAIDLLQSWGHRVTVADNGHIALDLFRERRFDLVFMDVQMPVMSGFEAVAAIRKYERQTGTHTPIIALTAYAMKGDREKCLAAGMDGYLSKPLRPQEVLAAIINLSSAFSEPEDPVPPDQSDRISDPEPAEIAEPQPEPQNGVFNPDELMTRVGGKMELVVKIGRIFLDKYPRQLSAIHSAIEEKDSQQLSNVAHALKGMLGNLSATTAMETAKNLELMGSAGDLSRAEEVYAVLETEITRFKQAFSKFADLDQD